ncbi:MAG: DegV family protein [Anaerolineae bacterium]|nr:DegV family protein [Anaerolineae bacterium]MDQ7034833.1 DegV family protein [Anaerolineae bacterium]
MAKKKIKIITDSVCDVPPDLLEKWQIDVVPCYVNYGGESYADDGQELDRTKFYQAVSSMKDFPSTAAPPPAVAEDIISRAIEGYDYLISINVAESLSGTYNNVRIAANNVAPDRITVIDSETVSMGIGWQAIVAAEVAAETGDVEVVKKAVEGTKNKHRLYAIIYTMEFLRRSGRVSSVVAGIGSILQIKPIVTVQEKGNVEAVHRVRTFSKARRKLKELLDAEGTLDRLAIIHTQNEEGARDFREEHRAVMPENTIITEVGPTLGTHIGLNSLGFVSIRK